MPKRPLCDPEYIDPKPYPLESPHYADTYAGEIIDYDYSFGGSAYRSDVWRHHLCIVMNPINWIDNHSSYMDRR